MTKLRLMLGVALVLVAVMLAMSALPAVSQQPPPRNTLTFFDPNKTTWEREIDAGRKGFSPGDTVLLVDAIFDPETCERQATLVGRLEISKFVSEGNAWYVGDFTLKLADGKLIAEAAAKFSEFEQTEKGVFAITGGTDAYRDASGEVKFEENQVRMCDRRGSTFTVDIGPQP